MELYKKLGLIYEQENGIKQQIANFDNLIGRESQSAVYKRQQNKLEKFQQNRLEKFQQNSNKIKILDTRDKIEDKDSNLVNLSKECVSKETTGTHTHVRPTLEEVTEYVKSQGLQVNEKRFLSEEDLKNKLLENKSQ